MKYIPKVLATVLFFLSSLISAQSYGLGDANLDLFSKYRVPETSYSTPRINVSFQFNDRVRDYSNQGQFTPNENTSSEFNFNLLPYYTYVYESEKRILKITGLTNFFYLGSNEESKFTNSKNKRERSRYNFNFVINSSYRNYFSEKSYFSYYLAPLFELQLLESDSKETNNGSDNSFYSQEKRQTYSVELGFSIGRIRNVTPVVSAIRYQQRMKQLNLLNTDLSDETLLDISRKFSQYNYYGNVYERSAKYFWNDLENVVKKYVPGYGGLNEYASAFLHEVPRELRFIRNEGFLINFFSRIDYENDFRKSTYYTSDRTENFYLMPGIELVYSTQLNLFSQLNFQVKANGGPNLTEKSEFKQKYYIRSEIGYSYELTDRLVCSFASNIDLEFINVIPQSKYFDFSNVLRLFYFVEDNISINTEFRWNITEYKNHPQIASHKDDIKAIELGLTYHFNRGFIVN